MHDDTLDKLEESIKAIKRLEEIIGTVKYDFSQCHSALKEALTAYVVCCNDVPVTVVIGNKQKAEHKVKALSQANSDSADMGIYHIRKAPWE